MVRSQRCLAHLHLHDACPPPRPIKATRLPFFPLSQAAPLLPLATAHWQRLSQCHSISSSSGRRRSAEQQEALQPLGQFVSQNLRLTSLLDLLPTAAAGDGAAGAPSSSCSSSSTPSPTDPHSAAAILPVPCSRPQHPLSHARLRAAVARGLQAGDHGLLGQGHRVGLILPNGG